jgi:hypothetical protein
MKYHCTQSPLFEKSRADAVRTYLADRGRAGLDESSDILSCGSTIIGIAELFFDIDKVHYPFREGLRAYGSKQGRQLKMGMDVDETGHEDCVIQLDNAMAWIFLDYPV